MYVCMYVHVSYSERFSLYISKIVDKKRILGTVSNKTISVTGREGP
jgi:hypothetical protein